MRRERTDLLPVLEELGGRLSKLEASIKRAEETLANARPKELSVSLHACIRYAERHYGIDMGKIRQEILAKVESFKDLGNCKVEGFVIQNNVVVSYYRDTGE